MTNWGKPGRRAVGCCLALLYLWGFSPCSTLGADLRRRLAAGEIITSAADAPDSTMKKGEATGVVEAPPAKVWEVVTDANNFQEFLPRMVKSRLVRLEELQKILQERPGNAAAAEAILGAKPPEPAFFRIPGQNTQATTTAIYKSPGPSRTAGISSGSGGMKLKPQAGFIPVPGLC